MKTYFVCEYDKMERDAYRQNWMSDAQWECTLMLRDFFRGFHHAPKIKCCGNGIEANTGKPMATWDFDTLTKLVIMSHDRCIRTEIAPSGPGRLKIRLWKRSAEGLIHERHPSLNEAIDKHHRPGYVGYGEVL